MSLACPRPSASLLSFAEPLMGPSSILAGSRRRRARDHDVLAGSTPCHKRTRSTPCCSAPAPGPWLSAGAGIHPEAQRADTNSHTLRSLLSDSHSPPPRIGVAVSPQMFAPILETVAEEGASEDSLTKGEAGACDYSSFCWEAFDFEDEDEGEDECRGFGLTPFSSTAGVPTLRELDLFARQGVCLMDLDAHP